MPESIRIDPASKVPPYEQIRAAVAGAAAKGEVPVGYKLPTVRALAERLSVAVNTVARAYRELEQAGVVGPVRDVHRCGRRRPAGGGGERGPGLRRCDLPPGVGLQRGTGHRRCGAAAVTRGRLRECLTKAFG